VVKKRSNNIPVLDTCRSVHISAGAASECFGRRREKVTQRAPEDTEHRGERGWEEWRSGEVDAGGQETPAIYLNV
jgi:hypothetical protein